MPKVVVAATIAGQPVSAAGITWAFLQWVLGFRELGWDTWMVDRVGTNCHDERWQPAPFAESANRAHWDRVVARFGLEGRATLLVGPDEIYGDDVREFAAEADLFVNLSGHFPTTYLPMGRGPRVYIDFDPAFTQIWAEAYGAKMNFAGHDAFFTIGTAFDRPQALVPTCGLEWRPTFTPVVLPYWPFVPQPEFGRFTTITQWTGVDSIAWDGRWYTGKGEEFAKLIDLPRQLGVPVEVATHAANHAAELAPFEAHGWRFVEAYPISATLEAHEAYVRGSSAEVSVAKGGYAISRAGWFGDRTAAYLASGRPVVLHDTGIGDELVDGEGIHRFRTVDEAARAGRRILEDFANQQHAARAVAERVLASDVVIGKLLDRL